MASQASDVSEQAVKLSPLLAQPCSVCSSWHRVRAATLPKYGTYRSTSDFDFHTPPPCLCTESLRKYCLIFVESTMCGFRTMPISVPGHADHPFRDDRDQLFMIVGTVIAMPR